MYLNWRKSKFLGHFRGSREGVGNVPVRTLQVPLRARLPRSGESGVYEIAVLADTGEVTGLAACGAESGEGGCLLMGVNCMLF